MTLCGGTMINSLARKIKIMIGGRAATVPESIVEPGGTTAVTAQT